MSFLQTPNKQKATEKTERALSLFSLLPPVHLILVFIRYFRASFSLCLIDAVEDAAFGEEFLLGFVSVSDKTGERKQFDLGKSVGIFFGHAGIDRPIIVPGDDLLRLVRVEKLQVSLRHGPRPPAIDIGV